jgi:formylmethanofuran dehydrogenase subunit C
MALRLQYRNASQPPIDLAGLTPDWVCAKSLREIQDWSVPVGNQAVALAELFDVAGDSGDGEIHLAGDLSNVDSIGAAMKDGIMRVEGSVGNCAGAGMAGGLLEIAGSAGDRLGCEMRGGRIHVHGDAGDYAGGALAGARRGMTGGELFIDGAAGNEIGRAMRRGLIVVGGAAGDSVGLNLIAGTIFVLGRCGPRPGVGMRRGTIAVFSPPVDIPLTFRPAVRQRPQFMRLLLNYLRQNGVPSAGDFLKAEFDSFGGDLLALGKGEILVARQ